MFVYFVFTDFLSIISKLCRHSSINVFFLESNVIEIRTSPVLPPESHTVLSPPTETGHVDSLLIERYNTPGFIGCLSRVQFNGVAPLKSALRSTAQTLISPTAAQPDRTPTSPQQVSYQGKLVESNCGASPLTIPPMSAATDPWHLDNTGQKKIDREIWILIRES